MLDATSFAGRRPEAGSLHALPWQLGDYVKHLSASSLNMGMRCPEQYRNRYILGRKQRPGAAQQLGSATWGAHIRNYEQKIETGEDFSLPDLSDAYATSWDETLERNGGVKGIQWSANPADVHSLGWQMTQVYHEQVSPRIQPTGVEERLNIKMPGVPVPILGFIDLVRAPGEPILDHKTSGKALKKPKPDWRLQGAIYSYHKKAPIEFHVVTKTKQPKVWTPLEAPDLFVPYDTDRWRVERKVRDAAWTLNYFLVTRGPHEPWPTLGTIHDWACDWCGFRSGCPAWAA